MTFKHPAEVIDQTVSNLEYLTEFFLDDIDQRPIDREQLSARVLRAVAALDAARILLPRLRIVRSNYVTDSRLPDSSSGAELLAQSTLEATRDASKKTATLDTLAYYAESGRPVFIVCDNCGRRTRPDQLELARAEGWRALVSDIGKCIDCESCEHRGAHFTFDAGGRVV